MKMEIRKYIKLNTMENMTYEIMADLKKFKAPNADVEDKEWRWQS